MRYDVNLYIVVVIILINLLLDETLENKWSDRSMEVKLLALLGKLWPTELPTNERPDRPTTDGQTGS